MRVLAAISALALTPAALPAMTLEFPGKSSTLAESGAANDSTFLPTARYADGPVEGITAEGYISIQSWRVGEGDLTTLQLLAPLREQLDNAGYELLFECETKICGGFDFRYTLDVLPEPDMHVNLGDYRYLLAQRIEDGEPDYAGIIVSRSAKAGFVQLTRVSQSTSRSITTSTKAPPPTTVAAGPVDEQLEAKGHATLGALSFKTGKSELSDESFASLSNLANYLASRPDRTVVLVGHTDSEGSLEGNVALSKKRATAVMQQLIEKYGVSAEQVSADGVGFLSPIASNLTAEGRSQNRRVEVILTSTE